jgi:hypothetical protein
MADSGSINIRNEQTTLFYELPSTQIYVSNDFYECASKTITETVPDDEGNDVEIEKSTEVETLKWNYIQRSVGQFSVAELEYNLEDEDGNTVYIEQRLLSDTGISIDEQNKDKYYVLITQKQTGVDEEALFLGYFTGANIDLRGNRITITAHGIEKLLSEQHITGRYAQYNTTPKIQWVSGECTFNDGINGVGESDGKYYFKDDDYGQTEWTMWQIIQYIENIFSEVQAYDDALVTSDFSPVDYPRRVGVVDESNIQATDIVVFRTKNALNNLGASSDTSKTIITPTGYYPSEFKLRGSLLDALNKIAKESGTVQLRHKIQWIQNAYRLVVDYVCTTSASSAKHDMFWGERDAAVTRKDDFETGTIELSRSQKVRKVVCYGAPTILQCNLIYYGNQSTLATGDWPDTVLSDASYPGDSDIDYVYGILKDDTSLTDYDRFRILNDPDTGPLGHATNSSQLTTAIDGARFFSIAKPDILDRLLTKVDEHYETPKIWWWNGTEWDNFANQGYSVAIREDNSGIDILANDDNVSALKTALQENDGYIIMVVALQLQHRIRAWAGLDDNNDIISQADSDTESDIDINSDDERMEIIVPQYRNEVVWKRWEYDTDTDAWSVEGGADGNNYTYNRDDRDDIKLHAKQLMGRLTQINNTGSMTLRGWKSGWSAGDHIYRLRGRGRIITIDSMIQSMTMTSNYQTIIETNRGNASAGK